MPAEKHRYEVEVQHPRYSNRWYDLTEQDEYDAEHWAKWEYKREFSDAKDKDLTVYVTRK